MSKSKDSLKRGAQPLWNASALIVAILACAFIGLGAYGKFDSPHPDKLVTLPSLGEVKLDLIVAACEVVIALALLFGHRLRAAWFCSTLLFGGLMGWVIFAMRTDMDCGCFGEFIKIEPEVSLTIDTVFFIASIGLLASHRRTGVVLPVIAVLLAGANSVVGYNFNKSTTTDAVARQTAAREAATEKAGNRSAAQRLLDSDLMKEVREREPGGKATYVFIYDPHCSVCADMFPLFEIARDNLERDQDPYLEIVIFNKIELSEQGMVEDYHWPGSPTTFLVQDGVITNLYTGEDARMIDPPYDTFYEEIITKTLAPNYDHETANPMGH